MKSKKVELKDNGLCRRKPSIFYKNIVLLAEFFPMVV